MKKIISLILTLVIVMTFGFTKPVFAAPTADETIGDMSVEDKSEKVDVINEYDIYKELKDLSESELKEKGLEDEAIDFIKEGDYKEELFRRSKLPDEELKTYGYDEEEIGKLRSYDGSEASTHARAAQAMIYSYLEENDEYNATVIFYWNWSARPFYLFKDSIACAWTAEDENGNSMSATLVPSKSYHETRTQTLFNGKINYSYDTKGVVADQGQKAVINFELGRSVSYVDSGRGQIKVNCKKKIGQLTMRFEYGHSYIALTPTIQVSYPWSGGISIAFSDGTSAEDFSYHVYDKYGVTDKEPSAWNKGCDGSWYWYGSNGTPIKSQWKQDKGYWYYLKSDGKMAIGWQKLDGLWYYLNDDGTMATGWKKVGSTWYYLNDNGVMATGWKQVGDNWYYLYGDGSMATGWLQDGSTWYYLTDTGAMVTGWKQISGTWYYFYTSGVMATNTTIDGWNINGSGVATQA